MFLANRARRCVRLTTSPPSVSRLSIQPYRPLRPVTGIAYLASWSCYTVLEIIYNVNLEISYSPDGVNCPFSIQSLFYTRKSYISSCCLR
jgi:hypothetical protein